MWLCTIYLRILSLVLLYFAKTTNITYLILGFFFIMFEAWGMIHIPCGVFCVFYVFNAALPHHTLMTEK